MNAPHTDILRRDWIERLPPTVRPYVGLARLDRPIGIWLLLLPGWWSLALASGGAQGLLRPALLAAMALFAVGAIVMRAAGCVVNDLWDRDLDARVARTRNRPLACGAIGLRGAVLFLAGLLGAGLLILLQFDGLTIGLGCLSLPLVAIYPLMKRWTWWPQLFLGITFNFGALMGWSAATGTLALPAILLYLSGIFWTLGYDTIYAHQDIEDDAVVGIKSSARRLAGRSAAWVASFYGLSSAFLIAAGWAGGAGALFVLGATGALAFNLSDVARWKPQDPQSCLKTFQRARIYGLLVLAAIALA